MVSSKHVFSRFFAKNEEILKNILQLPQISVTISVTIGNKDRSAGAFPAFSIPCCQMSILYYTKGIYVE